jgi:hypothetical protein
VCEAPRVERYHAYAGPLYAAAATGDKHHQRAIELLANSPRLAAAERRGIEVIATLDHRHFRAVRPRHVQAFTLVP